MNAPTARTNAPASRRFEAMMFLALSVLIWPFVAVGVVGAFGFSVWMYQMLSHSGGM
ncbi:periplasmic nitrate reductase, NapE protein [Azospirillum soli]|uniref:periplasmic nitrate reductase, NapE protein n=1 Tax=Azospirillum soli TaxID=1304799 RepID=UPI001AE99D86|nr:periplasmic nitrate reductase, NapE protein [Azospirillum soli]MBP2314254.1 nitrate reductase NapE [Azospirillum soli]